MEAAVAKAWAHVRANATLRNNDQWLKPVVLIEQQCRRSCCLGCPRRS